MLAWNAQRVKRLTPTEIWLFIAGRVLTALGAGLLLAAYWPPSAVAGWPALACGVALLLVAAKGMARRQPAPPDR